MTGANGTHELLRYLERHADDLLSATAEHAGLVCATLGISCAVAGVLVCACLARPRLARMVTEVAAALYAIPSLALFALLIPLTGLGTTTAVAVMTIYCQFILVRNALGGLLGVDRAIIEAATGMGMSPRQLLLRIRIPLALPSIISGIRLAALSCVGIATVAAGINAGGLGALLFSGLRSLHMEKIVTATACCVLLALAFDLILRLLGHTVDYRSHHHILKRSIPENTSVLRKHPRKSR